MNEEDAAKATNTSAGAHFMELGCVDMIPFDQMIDAVRSTVQNITKQIHRLTVEAKPLFHICSEDVKDYLLSDNTSDQILNQH